MESTKQVSELNYDDHKGFTFVFPDGLSVKTSSLSAFSYWKSVAARATDTVNVKDREIFV
jgi:hypothetical protein